MEGRTKNDRFASNSRIGHRGPTPQEPGHRAFSSKYFSAQKLLILLCVTASLLILPLILPPLPPPPLAVLLLPVGILVLLMILAFMPSDMAEKTDKCGIL